MRHRMPRRLLKCAQPRKKARRRALKARRLVALAGVWLWVVFGYISTVSLSFAAGDPRATLTVSKVYHSYYYGTTFPKACVFY